MSRNVFVSVQDAIEYLGSEDFQYSSEVEFVNGDKCIILATFVDSIALMHDYYRTEFVKRSKKDAFWDVFKSLGPNTMDAVYNGVNGNVWGTIKPAMQIFLGLGQDSSEDKFIARLKSQDENLYKVAILDALLRRRALFSYRHIVDKIYPAQNGPGKLKHYFFEPLIFWYYIKLSS